MVNIEEFIDSKIKAYVVNVGRGPQPDTEKHRKMFRDYYANKPMFEISSIYKISPQRINQIRTRYKLPTREKLLKGKGVR